MSAEHSGASDAPIEITDANFDSNVKKNKILVIDCWAPWCGPCRMLAPTIEALAKDFKGKIVFGKLNTDDNVQISTKYGIMSIPTLLYFKNGDLVERTVGAMPRAQIEEHLNCLL